ncbi:MAG: ribonuclease HI [Bacteroidetes bacterium]|jgi:ribonuclease HI|nr:ribonuclease HI [Bacteroidota bacterium]MBX7127850.1 ribonuclease HI [Flavobacteriales bacterium]MCC6654133.1 ribonuclease HI [Flavobacteriales bacterium]HMU14845.1 ribonuclease HI [Flavobacteriales bacterium]HMW96064.1 ribonuclease HI [Flavobacteriales bacterium]
MRVTAYTDGAASGNPGPGGYGAVLEAGKHRRELWGGYRRTTNNRMELMAVIVALEALKLPGMEVTVVSDSKYVVDAVEQGWLFDWEKKGFAKKKNPDLWKRFLAIYRQHKVRFEWIRGHNGHPQNELCDRLAVAAREQPGLPPDEAYERTGEDLFSE